MGHVISYKTTNIQSKLRVSYRIDYMYNFLFYVCFLPLAGSSRPKNWYYSVILVPSSVSICKWMMCVFKYNATSELMGSSSKSFHCSLRRMQEYESPPAQNKRYHQGALINLHPKCDNYFRHFFSNLWSHVVTGSMYNQTLFLLFSYVYRTPTENGKRLYT